MWLFIIPGVKWLLHRRMSTYWKWFEKHFGHAETWWHHDMETHSVFLILSERNRLASSHKCHGQFRFIYVFIVLSLNKLFNKQSTCWPPTCDSGGVNKVPWDVVGLAFLIQEAHWCAKDTVQGGSQPHPSSCSFEVGRRQRHTPAAVLGHCSFQAGLWLHFVQLSIKHGCTATWQHP